MDSKLGKRRAEGSFDIKEIYIKEDISNLNNTMIDLDLENINSRGIINFNIQEINKLINSIKGKVPEIKIIGESKNLKKMKRKSTRKIKKKE